MDDPSSTNLIFLLSLGTVLATLLAAMNAGLNVLGTAHLEALSEGEGRTAKVAGAALGRLEALRTRLLVGRIAFVTIAASSAVLLALPLGPWAGIAAGFLLGMLYALLAEMVRGVVSKRPAKMTIALLRVMRPIELFVAPLAAPIVWLGRGASSAMPQAALTAGLASRAVEHLIEQGEERGQIAESQAQLLYSVLEFRDTIAREIMVPRTLVQAFERETSLEHVLERIESSAHSRYPVYRESIDHIEGILYAKDVFRLLRTQEDREASIESLIRPVFHAHETQKIGVLLREMQANRFHLAVVVDEFGGVAGIVTLEDIVEEIVGEIEDEHDDAVPRIEALTEGCWSIDAGLSLADVEDVVDLPLDADDADYDSIGGLVTHIAGEVPEVGQVLTFAGCELTVLAADERRVSRVELRLLESTSSAEVLEA